MERYFGLRNADRGVEKPIEERHGDAPASASFGETGWRGDLQIWVSDCVTPRSPLKLRGDEEGL